MEFDFLKIHEMKDNNNKKSIFSANSYSEIMIAKKYTMTKLYKFFEKIRFDPIEDQIVKIATRLFIRDFVNEKIKKF